MSEQVQQNNVPESASASLSRTQENTKNSVSLAGSRGGILGIKAGMTQIFTKDGDLVPVTVLDLKPTIITQVKRKESDGYTSVQVGICEKKPQRASRAEKGHFKKAGAPGFYSVTELRTEEVTGLKEGMTLLPDFVSEGDLVDVTATSKGKGYQGGMKRYGMHGGHKTHGASLSHRSLGSIGNRADPGKCFKNKKMPGHMGNERVTIQNLRVISIDHENQVLIVKGSVPGPKNGVVIVRKAIKKEA